MLLRKHLSGAAITNISQHGLERVIRIELNNRNELGDSVDYSLIIELMGKHSNLILTDIQTGKIKPVSRQLQANPKAEICAFADGTWVRVAGKLIRDDRIEAKKHMLDQYPALQAMYSAEDDNTEVLYFEDAVATFASFGGAPRTVTF